MRNAVSVLVTLLAACSATGPVTETPSPRTDGTSRVSPTPAVSVWPPSAQAPLSGERAARLQDEIGRWVHERLIPGVTAAVVTPSGAWVGSAGVDGAGTPLQPRSGMALASITKTFIAAEMLRLAEMGAVDLDEAASAYLPIPQVANGVTLRQLLAQRSGVAESRETPLGDPNTAWTTQRYLSHVPRATAPPGAAFVYDNSNYVLLGLVIEKVTGRPLATVLQTDLFRPAGLIRIAYQDAQRLDPPLARPPASAADAAVKGCDGQGPYLPCRALATVFGPAGALAGDAETVARWGYVLYGSRLLKTSSVAEMTDFSDGDGYGLGTVDFAAVGNGRWNVAGVGHTGESIGYRSVLAVLPQAHVSVAILSPSEVEVLPLVQYLLKAGSFTT